MIIELIQTFSNVRFIIYFLNKKKHPHFGLLVCVLNKIISTGDVSNYSTYIILSSLIWFCVHFFLLSFFIFRWNKREDIVYNRKLKQSIYVRRKLVLIQLFRQVKAVPFIFVHFPNFIYVKRKIYSFWKFNRIASCHDFNKMIENFLFFITMNIIYKIVFINWTEQSSRNLQHYTLIHSTHLSSFQK